MSSVDRMVGGVDIGTSGVRCIFFDPQGNVLASSYREYPTISERVGWAELDPEVVLSATIGVIGEASRTVAGRHPGLRPAAIGLSSALFSVMALDRDGQPLTRILTWMDNRAAGESEQLVAQGGAHDLYRRTGCRVHPMYPLSKLFWLKKHQPDVWQAAERWVTTKEWVIWRLFGARVVDYSLASASGLFNIHDRVWDPAILDLVGLAPGQLSEPVDALHTVSGLPQDLAEAMGIPADTPFVLGAGDGMLAHIGTGCFEKDRFSCTIGTSGALRVMAPQPLLDDQERTWCYCLDKDTWVAGGAINNGGIVLRWLRDRLSGEEVAAAKASGQDPYQLLCDMAAGVPAGAEGLVMLPFLTGERSPNWNAQARGVLFGLGLHHTKAHLVRAALEAVIYRMRSVYDALHSLSGVEGSIWANGGYTRSELWLQIQADIFGRPVFVPKAWEASAFGAAILAMKAAGTVESYRDLEPHITVERVYEPNQQNFRVYEEGYGLFKNLYDDVKHEFGRWPGLDGGK